MRSLFGSDNHLFVLARSGKRLTHIALALVLGVVFPLAGALLGGLVLLPFFLLIPNIQTAITSSATLSGFALALQLIASFGPIFLLIWAWTRWFEGRSFRTLGWEWPGALRKYLIGVLVGLLTFGASIGLMAAFGYVAPEQGDPQQQGVAALGGVLLVYLGWTVQGPAEELLCRGFLLQAIGARYRPWLGVLLSSLVFMALHGLNANISLLPLINLFLFGVFAALYALLEGGLWGIAAWHAVWNWAQGNIFGFEVSGSGGLFTLFNLQETGPDLITGGGFGPEGGLAVTAVLIISIAIILALAGRRGAAVGRSVLPA